MLLTQDNKSTVLLRSGGARTVTVQPDAVRYFNTVLCRSIVTER